MMNALLFEIRYPELRCKGSDSRVVLGWLNDELQTKGCSMDDVASVTQPSLNIYMFGIFPCILWFNHVQLFQPKFVTIPIFVFWRPGSMAS